ncbi:hypothetical protein LWP59_22475 [Amycolatopsis acidiphila]|uniref:Uncharacterized protein n=1 Tax=Amycolatopsis acidiphila TaxID=715473 RepID=A0A558A5E1_9PSEU|nr:hypothetical protein [Amycolatopsis acidiphila]TVT19484.1 hypothetical protein FNH06_23865 [Amycolatopsis acidiphila]UIJ56928.1 hypothetical protein LWP59_22475 [Amycolatopsis acidiphila]GHG54293.1 hypothetical protein GCM10017788_03870 [Amycolatopsis acidiphila]
MCSTDETGSVETRLMDLIGRGYRFIHPRDSDGAIVAVVGVRPHGTVIDILRLDAENDATALRVPADEQDLLAPSKTLWHCRGAAGDVLDELLALPDDILTGSPAA